MARWSFEYKITLGNLMSVMVVIASVTIGYTRVTTAIEDLREAVRPIPTIQARVSTLENQFSTSAAAQARLEGRSDKQDETQNQILQTLARIEERVAAIQETERSRK